MVLSTFNFFAVAALAAIVGVTLIVVYLNLRKVRGELDALREEFSLWRRAAATASPEPPYAAAALQAEPPPAESSQQVAPAVCAQDEEAMRERLHGGGGGGDGQAPERYRHVATLADKGLGAEEIAEVLQVSSDEARQLVKLSEVARKKS